MSSPLDSLDIFITCENCRRKTKKTVRWVKDHAKFTCRCGTVINLQTREFKSKIRSAERDITDFQGLIDEFGE